MLRDRLRLSERRACRIVGQHRSTQRRPKTVAADDQALRAELREIAGERPRWGYRRAHHELGLRGWQVNRKRVQRVWREEGLRVPRRSRKRRVPADRPDRSALRAGRPDEVWAVDFQHDQTADGSSSRTSPTSHRSRRRALRQTPRGPNPDAATHTEPWATARFPNVEQARAAARLYRGCVSDLMARGAALSRRPRGQPSRAGGA